MLDFDAVLGTDAKRKCFWSIRALEKDLFGDAEARAQLRRRAERAGIGVERFVQ
jgi:hypothetical protein